MDISVSNYFKPNIMRIMELSQQSYLTLLVAPEGYGKHTIAEVCAKNLGGRVFRAEVPFSGQEALTESFLSSLYEGNIPETVTKNLMKETKAEQKSLEREIKIAMKKKADALELSDSKEDYVVILSHTERFSKEGWDVVRSFLQTSVQRWHFYAIYEKGIALREEDILYQLQKDLCFKNETVWVDEEDLRFHAEDIYELFLEHHIPVTIEAVVSLYQHANGAVREVTDVLLLQMKKESSLQKLTKRELEIASMASSGLTNEEIAKRLYISENTVKSALKSVFFKLQIDSRRKLISLIHPETRML